MFIRIHFRQVCLYDGDTIVVLALLLSVDYLIRFWCPAGGLFL